MRATPRVDDIIALHSPAGAMIQICGDATVPAGEPCPRPTPQEATNTTYVKRVVAGPGDRIAIRRGRVILNGTRQKETFAKFAGCNPSIADCSYPKTSTIPAGYYFVLGDNRDFSDDSRFWGPVPGAWIEGRAITVGRGPTAACTPLR